ncbi:hypothetical protein J7E91_05850 [Streptomyces sp. ISL-99]|nr:hypothetical protein [Streptomyces sp. ISL-99]
MGNRISAIQRALGAVWEESPEYFDDIDRDDFINRLDSFSPAIGWQEPIDKATEEHHQAWETVAKSSKMRDLADWGWVLFEQIFPPGHKLRRKIDALDPGDFLHINWYSKHQAVRVPWSLLHRHEPPSEGSPVDPLDFLGLRLRIAHKWHDPPGETSKALESIPNESESPRATRAHIFYWGSGGTAATAQEHLQDLEQWCTLPLPTGGENPKEQVCRFLKTPGPRPVALIYVYCKCSTGSASGPNLLFGNTPEPANELSLADLGTGCIEDHPLVFINACDTASSHPFFDKNEIQERFFRRDCRAYVGSECKVPIKFAARFAVTFFHFLYLRPGDTPTPAGEALTRARKFFWDEYRNIGGLFYSYVNDYDLFMAPDEDVAALRRSAIV